MKSNQKSKFIFDRIGIILSGICIIHCMLVPVLLLAFPFIQNGLLHLWYHKLSFALVTIVGIFSFIPGFKKHKQIHILGIALLGAILLLVSTFVEHLHFHGPFEYLLSLAGGIILIYAHFKNMKCAHKTCHHH